MVGGKRSGQGFGLLTAEEIQEFDSVFKEFLQDSVDLNDAESVSMDSMRDWMLKAMEYNVSNKNDNDRRYLFPMAYKNFARNPSSENMRIAYFLGWVLEMYHASGIVADDFMDGNDIREGKSTWDKIEGTGPIAVNDSLMLRLGSLRLLTKYCGEQSFYLRSYRFLRQALDKWIIGRLLSDQCLKRKENDESLQDRLSLERYANIVKYKTTWSTLSLPINLAIIMADKDNDVEFLKTFNEILFDIGHYLQVKEDFSAVFNSPSEIKEEDSLIDHIRTGWVNKEWSWLTVQAAQKSTSDKLEELAEKMKNLTNSQNLKVLRDEFERLGLKEVYIDEQKKCLRGIMKKIEEMPSGDHKNFLFALFAK